YDSRHPEDRAGCRRGCRAAQRHVGPADRHSRVRDQPAHRAQHLGPVGAEPAVQPPRVHRRPADSGAARSGCGDARTLSPAGRGRPQRGHHTSLRGCRRGSHMSDRLPVSLSLYRFATRAATPFANQLLRHRLKQGKEHSERLPERRGESDVSRPRGALVWVHGASVGELVAAFPLVERIKGRGLPLLVTSGTVTSAAIARQRLPPGVIHQFVPLDAPGFVNRFLDHWQPRLALFIESDLWPNLILSCGQRSIPLILINGRLSERSYKRWRFMPSLIGALLANFDL